MKTNGKFQIISSTNGFIITAAEPVEKLRGLAVKLKTVENILQDYSNEAIDILETDVKTLSDLVDSAKELVVESRRALENKITDLEYSDEILAEAIRRMKEIPIYKGVSEKDLNKLASYAIDHNLKIINDAGLKEHIEKTLKAYDSTKLIETILDKADVVKKGEQLSEKKIGKKDAYDKGFDYYQSLLGNRIKKSEEVSKFADKQISINKKEWLNKYYNNTL